MLKINNKDKRMMFYTVLLSVSIADFEQVNLC